MKKKEQRNKLALISVIMAVLLLISMVTFAIVNGKQITERNRAYLMDCTKAVAVNIDNSIQEGMANIKMLRDLVSNSLTGPEFDVADLQSIVHDSAFDFIEFADAEGMNHNITGGTSYAKDRRYFWNAQSGNSGIELLYISRATYETLLDFYTPLYYNGEFIGSLVGVYQASNKITNLLTTDYFGEPALTFLVSNEGRIIASNEDFDATDELYVSGIVDCKSNIKEMFRKTQETSETNFFDVADNRIGGCIVKLPSVSYYVVQIFPAAAGKEMINSSNWLSYGFMAFLILLSLCVFIVFRKYSISQQKKLEESKNTAEESLVFTNYFLESYISAYHVNLDDYTYTAYKRTAELEKEFPTIGNYFESINAYINTYVHPDDRDEFRKLIEPENVKKILKDNKEYDHLFRDISDEKEKIYRLQIIHGTGKNLAAFGFKDVTKEIKEHEKYLLGAIPLSTDVLTKANIGLWAFELDEGEEPRMYADEAMLGLIGLDHQVPPNETYHAWYDNIDNDSYDLVAETVEKMTAGEHAEVQYPWHHPDGRTFIVRCGGVRNYEYSKGIRIEGTHQNVTEVIHYDEEKRRKENDNLLFMLIDVLSDAFSVLYYIDSETAEYQMISRNTEYEENVQSKIVNRGNFFADTEESTPLVVYEEDTKKISALYSKEAIEKAFGDNESFSINYRIMIDENKVWYRIKAVKVKDANGKLFYVVGVSNIEEELKKQAELQDALEMAQIANKAKTDFLFNMSHDIRTPMNAIVGFTNMAQKHIDEKEKVIDSLEKTRQASELLISLINSILDMSRIESGKAVVEQDEGDVSLSFSSIESTMNELAKAKDIDLKFENGSIKDRYVYYDHNRCIRIFVNIISNAIKYTPGGGKVLVKCEQIASENGIGTYKYTFTDNGIGMSDEFQKHVFEEFSREHNSTISGIQGTGLGLAVCKSFAELMGGSIECRSKKGTGSTFTVILPFRIREVDAGEITQAEETKQADAFDFSGKKVLLVEDNMLNREIATDILEEEGMIVESAEDGSVAVEMMKKKGPDYFDFILMDIQMPVMNGYEATKAIREMYPDSDIKIIAVSANAFAEDKSISIAAGMNDHVAKPINIRILLETLQKLM